MPSDSQVPGHSAASPSPALVLALRRALRPLVRLMVARGLTLGYLVELLKSLLVEVADQDFRIADKPPTDSRVSLVTGVHRKDVVRIRQQLASDEPDTPSVISLGARVLALWQGAPTFLDADGEPLPLPRFASEGGPVSFEALVASVNSDIRSRVVLDEWLRLGLVRMDDERRVHLNTGAFVPAHDSDDKAFYLGHNLHDHAAAATHNMLGVEPPCLERSVHYSGVPTDVVQSLAAQAKTLGMKALLAVNKSAQAAIEPAPGRDTGTHRMTFGIYFFSEPTEVAPKVLPTATPVSGRVSNSAGKTKP